jgi:threonine dehydrogenase-like Zn-dependent dehydrogenase
MKALVRIPGGVELAEQPDPVPQPDEVVVAIHSCGICGSDLHIAASNRPGGIPGHEFSATVASLGRDVSGWRVGQPVAVIPLGGCGSCTWCDQDLLILCRNRPNLGLNAPGAFAEYAAVHHSQLFALPDGMDIEHGSRVEPLAVALRAIAEAAPAPTDNALVYGVGPIGLSVIVGLRALGAGTIVAVGRSSAGRRAAAATLGADVVLDSRETDVAEYVHAAGIELKQAYECSGDPQALVICGRALSPGGAIVALALSRTPATFDTHLFVTRKLSMLSACAYGNRDFGRALELIGSGAADVRPLISDRVSLAQAPAAFERLRHPGDLVSVLVQPWRSDSR